MPPTLVVYGQPRPVYAFVALASAAAFLALVLYRRRQRRGSWVRWRRTSSGSSRSSSGIGSGSMSPVSPFSLLPPSTLYQDDPYTRKFHVHASSSAVPTASTSSSIWSTAVRSVVLLPLVVLSALGLAMYYSCHGNVSEAAIGSTTSSSSPPSPEMPSVMSCQTTENWPGWKKLRYAFVFGDSYSQTGFDPSAEPAPSPEHPLGNPPYPGWTSSNGPNWVDYLTTDYNGSRLQTYNLAFGGATVDADLVKPYAPGVLSFRDQVLDVFLPGYTPPAAAGAGAGIDDPPLAMSPPQWHSNDALFLIWMGINDVGNSYEQFVQGGDDAEASRRGEVVATGKKKTGEEALAAAKRITKRQEIEELEAAMRMGEKVVEYGQSGEEESERSEEKKEREDERSEENKEREGERSEEQKEDDERSEEQKEDDERSEEQKEDDERSEEKKETRAMEDLHARIVARYSTLLDTLYDAGARNFALLNVPPVDRSPLTTAKSNAVEAQRVESASIADFNARLGLLVTGFQSKHQEDTNVWLVDVATPFGKILDHPATYPQTAGLQNTTDFCVAYKDGTPSQDTLEDSCHIPANAYFWLNSLHPTSAVHEVLAAEVAEALEAGPNVCTREALVVDEEADRQEKRLQKREEREEREEKRESWQRMMEILI